MNPPVVVTINGVELHNCKVEITYTRLYDKHVGPMDTDRWETEVSLITNESISAPVLMRFLEQASMVRRCRCGKHTIRNTSIGVIAYDGNHDLDRCPEKTLSWVDTFYCKDCGRTIRGCVCTP